MTSHEKPSKAAPAQCRHRADALARRQARMYAVTGMLHLAVPGVYERIIPEALPGTPRQWAVGSGVAELGVAGLLAMPRTRRLGGAASAALLVGVWPGNLKMALDWRDKPWPAQAVAIGRLPLQIPLIRSAMTIARSAGPRSRTAGGPVGLGRRLLAGVEGLP
ncbi:hypothetical protein [Kocuria palustris]|uniref:DoxX family protein n=1 Tax=Kocuria palustris TaxID=71999 RepID=UPI0028CB69F5|nr:hypothetical protein [Kocuria palustris]